MKIYRWLPGFIAGLYLTVLAPDVFSAELMVTRSFTGAWDQINQESQGLSLQVIEQANDARVALAYWYTYGTDRKSAWYLGVGQIVDDHINFELYNAQDVGFMEDGKPGDESVRPIGTMTMTFTSCDSGTVTFATNHDEVGSGSFEIGRLTETLNTQCSGGISDDMDAMATLGDQRIQLTSTREGIDASGHARYEDAPGRSQFEIETDGLPDGDYHLYVGTDDRGEFTVSGGRGELEFSSPMESGKRLLTFDPHEMQIRIHDGTGEVLSSLDGIFEREAHGRDGDQDHDYDCESGMGMGNNENHRSGDCVAAGEALKVTADLVDTGQFQGASGEAQWQMTSGFIEFSVDIEDVPAGNYPVAIGGREVGIIVARKMMYSGVYGRIMFRDPQLYGGYQLDFDPRGQAIEITQQNNVILRVNFPVE